MSWRKGVVVALLWGLVLCLPEVGQAHRVNIFAWVQGAQIAGECAFTRGSGVRQGRIVVRDAVSDAQLGEWLTDDQGRFQFPVPEAAVRAGHGIRITILAGEGHQNSMEVPLEDLQGALASGAAVAGARLETGADGAEAGNDAALEEGAGKEDATAGPAAEEVSQAFAAETGLTATQIQRIVETALDSRLKPLYRHLAAREEAGPSLRDIVGGIGWILGLVGIAAYCRRRR